MVVFMCWSRGGDLGGFFGCDFDSEVAVLDVVNDVAGSVAAGGLAVLLAVYL